MIIVAWPILMGTGSAKEEKITVSERTQTYTTAKNLLITGADAVERIMTSFKEVSLLARLLGRLLLASIRVC